MLARAAKDTDGTGPDLAKIRGLVEGMSPAELRRAQNDQVHFVLHHATSARKGYEAPEFTARAYAKYGERQILMRTGQSADANPFAHTNDHSAHKLYTALAAVNEKKASPSEVTGVLSGLGQKVLGVDDPTAGLRALEALMAKGLPELEGLFHPESSHESYLKWDTQHKAHLVLDTIEAASARGVVDGIARRTATVTALTGVVEQSEQARLEKARALASLPARLVDATVILKDTDRALLESASQQISARSAFLDTAADLATARRATLDAQAAAERAAAAAAEPPPTRVLQRAIQTAVRAGIAQDPSASASLRDRGTLGLTGDDFPVCPEAPVLDAAPAAGLPAGVGEWADNAIALLKTVWPLTSDDPTWKNLRPLLVRFAMAERALGRADYWDGADAGALLPVAEVEPPRPDPTGFSLPFDDELSAEGLGSASSVASRQALTVNLSALEAVLSRTAREWPDFPAGPPEDERGWQIPGQLYTLVDSFVLQGGPSKLDGLFGAVGPVHLAEATRLCEDTVGLAERWKVWRAAAWDRAMAFLPPPTSTFAAGSPTTRAPVPAADPEALRTSNVWARWEAWTTGSFAVELARRARRIREMAASAALFDAQFQSASDEQAAAEIGALKVGDRLTLARRRLQEMQTRAASQMGKIHSAPCRPLWDGLRKITAPVEVDAFIQREGYAELVFDLAWDLGVLLWGAAGVEQATREVRRLETSVLLNKATSLAAAARRSTAVAEAQVAGLSLADERFTSLQRALSSRHSQVKGCRDAWAAVRAAAKGNLPLYFSGDKVLAGKTWPEPMWSVGPLYFTHNFVPGFGGRHWRFPRHRGEERSRASALQAAWRPEPIAGAEFWDLLVSQIQDELGRAQVAVAEARLRLPAVRRARDNARARLTRLDRSLGEALAAYDAVLARDTAASTIRELHGLMLGERLWNQRRHWVG